MELYGTNYVTQGRFYATDTTGGGYYVTDIWNGVDILEAGLGNDAVYGLGGSDTLAGGDGNDTVQGNAAADQVFGQLGNDVLYGGQGTDFISGAGGNDFLSGDLQADYLNGGSGADTFYIGSATIDTDTVQDFNYTEGDRVRVASGVSYSLAQSGADVVVQLGGSNQLVVLNQTLASLPSDWIYS